MQGVCQHNAVWDSATQSGGSLEHACDRPSCPDHYHLQQACQDTGGQAPGAQLMKDICLELWANAWACAWRDWEDCPCVCMHLFQDRKETLPSRWGAGLTACSRLSCHGMCGGVISMSQLYVVLAANHRTCRMDGCSGTHMDLLLLAQRPDQLTTIKFAVQQSYRE